MDEDLNWAAAAPSVYDEDGEGYHHDNREEGEGTGVDEEGLPSMETDRLSMTKPEVGGQEHKCKICSMTFEDAEETRLHYKTVHRKKKVSYMCPICEAEFAIQRIFNVHFKNAHMEPPVKKSQKRGVTATDEALPSNSKGVRRKYKKRRKTNAGPDSGLASASLEPEDVRDAAVLPLPALPVPPPKPKPLGKGNFSCNLCGHRFPNENKLKRHFMELHLQVKENECDLCGKTFGRKSTLNRHRREVHQEIEIGAE